jgi:hypothetical protein
MHKDLIELSCAEIAALALRQESMSGISVLIPRLATINIALIIMQPSLVQVVQSDHVQHTSILLRPQIIVPSANYYI